MHLLPVCKMRPMLSTGKKPPPCLLGALPGSPWTCRWQEGRRMAGAHAFSLPFGGHCPSHTSPALRGAALLPNIQPA